jgi:hypothetical protein
MNKTQTKRYGHLYDMVGQLQQLLEPDFMKEITVLVWTFGVSVKKTNA